MAMEINSVYGKYAGTYTNQKETKQVKDSKATNEVTKSTSSSVAKTNQNADTRKTASDELAYLSKKYDGYSFVGANYRQGMGYGSNDTVNVAISPAFLKKMANNPELEEQYEKEIANMKACDDRLVRSLEGQGDRVIAKGWAIDKDGNISSWVIGERGGNRPKVVSPNEYGAKIRKQKEEKKKAEAKIAAKQKEKAEQREALEEKIEERKKEQNELKEQISSDIKSVMGEKYKGVEMIDAYDNDGLVAVSEQEKNTNDLVGLNLDMKL